MRKKLILLTLALATVAGAGLFSAPPSNAAAACDGILVCCPDGTRCRCCARPCPIQCP